MQNKRRGTVAMLGTTSTRKLDNPDHIALVESCHNVSFAATLRCFHELLLII